MIAARERQRSKDLPMQSRFSWVLALLALALVPSCQEEPNCGDLCRSIGYCTPKDGKCVAATDEDCRESEICKTDGMCAAKDGACIAGKDEDCKPTRGCKTAGRCYAKDGACVHAAAFKTEPREPK